MDSRGEIRKFLASRRARVTPARVGVETFGGKRRVPDLARFGFLDPRAGRLYPNWQRWATTIADLLRTEASRTPARTL